MGVRVSQVKPSNCFRLHHTSMIYKHWNSYREIYGSMNLSTIPVPGSLYTARKLVLLSAFDIFHHWWCETCRVIQPTTVLNERMWHFGGQNTLWPLLHIFKRVKTHNSPGSAPLTPCIDGITWPQMLASSAAISQPLLLLPIITTVFPSYFCRASVDLDRRTCTPFECWQYSSAPTT